MLAIPTTKNIHFSTSNNIGRVVESGRWCSCSTRSLVPSHGHRIKSVKIFKSLILSTFASKDDNTRSCKQSSMTKPWRWRRSLNLWLNPSARIQIENMCIIQIHVSLLLPSVVVPTKIKNGCTYQRRRMPTSSAWCDSFDLWKCPKP